jgi:hypothetical protein
MCLKISPNQEKNEKDLQDFINGRDKIFIYKTLQKRVDENFYRSLIFDFTWEFKKQKVFEVDRSSKPTEYELLTGQISHGLHVYTSFEVAKIFTDYNQNERIVKFKISDEDIVAIENGLAYRANFKELVCTRLEFVEILRH